MFFCLMWQEKDSILKLVAFEAENNLGYLCQILLRWGTGLEDIELYVAKNRIFSVIFDIWIMVYKYIRYVRFLVSFFATSRIGRFQNACLRNGHFIEMTEKNFNFSRALLASSSA